MRTTMHITFDRISYRSPALLALAAKAATWPARLVRAPLEALNRRREQARLEAELAALDRRLLADIGLRRAPADQWQAVDSPCG